MAITSGYFNSVNGDRKYNADQMSEYFEGIINEGVCQHIDGGLAVTAGTGLSVNVAAGKAFIGKKWIRNDASLTLTISAASASYARIDAVVLRRNNTTRTCQIVVKSGTPAASPAAPTMTRNSTTYEMALAYVNVAANATSVTVTDKRADTTVCGWATVAESVPGEIDAQLNAMKTGFDGVTYTSPVEMVQGCDELLQSEFENAIKNSTGFESVDLSLIENRGYFMNTSGNPTQTSGAFMYSDPIPVVRGKKYFFYGNGTSLISGLTKCDASGNSRQSVATYPTNGYNLFSYEPTKSEYLIVSGSYDLTLMFYSVDAPSHSIGHYANVIEGTTEEKTNLVDISTLQVGKNWQNATAANRAIVNVEIQPSTKYYVIIPPNGKLTGVNLVQKTNVLSAAALVSSGHDNGTTYTFTSHQEAHILTMQFNGITTLSSSDFTGYYPVVSEGDFNYSAIDCECRKNLYWKNKKMVWLGTSIPAAGKYNINNPNSYPYIVGQILNCTVYNEAVGSSALHCKRPDLISEQNPYGFMNNFEAVSRCITNSLDEMNWIIQHYNDANVFTQNVPASLSDADKEFIRSCSWEIKLQKYFNADDFPDVWVMDHGHNDIPSDYSEGTYTAKTAITGTQHSGYYNGGQYISSDSSSYIEYGIEDELYIWISGTIGAWYDVFDLVDANGNITSFKRYASQTEITDLIVPCANAKKVRVSNVNTLISTIAVKKLTYPTYESLYSFNGGFDFIINKIKSYNPKARIIVIGEYENQKYPTISENQKMAAERWEFPLYKQWEKLGFSQQYIYIDGEWKTYLDVYIPDGLHPHTDTSGYALEYMAENIAAWMNTIR